MFKPRSVRRLPSCPPALLPYCQTDIWCACAQTLARTTPAAAALAAATVAASAVAVIAAVAAPSPPSLSLPSPCR